MKKQKTIWFDMDGTLADLYAVEGWLDDLENGRVRPYKEAAPLVNLQALAHRLNNLQKQGYRLGIVSWLSKSGDAEYKREIIKAKRRWLNLHLHSVQWNEIVIVPYGVPKSSVVSELGILFDDEEQNRTDWGENAFDMTEIFEVLRSL